MLRFPKLQIDNGGPGGHRRRPGRLCGSLDQRLSNCSVIRGAATISRTHNLRPRPPFCRLQQLRRKRRRVRGRRVGERQRRLAVRL